MLDDGPRCEVRDAAEDQHRDRFAFERLDRFDLRARHQREHRRGHKAGDDFDRHPRKRAADRRAADAGRVIHFATA